MSDAGRLVEWDPKDPAEAIFYGLDFVDRVAAGVTLSSAVWTFTPAGSLSKSTELLSGTQAYVKLAGGALGETYLVTCAATPSDGQAVRQTAILKIRGR